jgi:pullulanase-type alpha-1,6-glucosidase
MSRSLRDLLKLSSVLLLATFGLAGCGSGSGGSADLDEGGGGAVVQYPPVTVADSFNFKAPLGYFVLGTPPQHARFAGGTARGTGAWTIAPGKTAVIDFGTPADAVKFTAKDNFVTPLPSSGTSAGSQKTTLARVAQKSNPPFDQDIFVRGTELGWAAVPAQQLTETADNKFEVTLPLTTATTGSAGEFKIADAGWATANCGANSTSADIAIGSVYEMACGTNPPNLKLSITEDANYKFALDTTDAAKPKLSITKVTSGGGGGGGDGGGTRACGLTDQGLDNAAPFGSEVFIRGSVKNDWAAAPENKLINFGGNVLKTELEVEAGAKEFKVADAGWASVNCGANSTSADIALGAAYEGACGTNPPNIKFAPAENACYEFAVNAANKDKPVVTIKKADLSTGGGEEPTDTIEVRIYAVDPLTAGAAPTLLKTVKGIGSVNVDELRRGGETRITRIEIENKAASGDVGLEDFSWTANPRFAPAKKSVDVYYRRESGGYANTRITVDGTAYTCTATADSAFGCVARGIPAYAYANTSMSISNGTGTPATETINFNADSGSQPIYAFSGSPEARVGTPGESGKPAAVPRNANEVILFYKRDDNVYTGWGVHLFPTDPATGDWTTWPAPHPYEGVDPLWGAYFRITLPQNANPKYSANPGSLTTFPKTLGFIIHKGDTKDPGPDQFIRIAEDGNVLFVVSGVNDVGGQPPLGTSVKIINAAAHWVTKSTVLYKPAASAGVTKTELLFSPDGTLKTGVNGFEGTYQTIVLGAGSNPQLPNMKHLSTYTGYSLPTASVDNAKNLARGQLVLVGRDAFGDVKVATNVQTPGAIDDIYAAAAKNAALGPTYAGGVPSLKVWAPTALTNPGVSVKIYDASGALKETAPMTLDANSGVWSVQGKSEWNRQYYTFNLKVWSYAANAMVTNEVTDPYAVSLSTNSQRSQFVNLDDADLKPAGWDTLTKPAVAAPEDHVFYELHVRDFSIFDASVPAADRGKFTAFDVPGTVGRTHLQELAQAGITHVHVLPAFDIATVQEDRNLRVELEDDVAKLCAANPAAASLCPGNNGKTIRQLLNELTAQNRAGEQQQQIIDWMRGVDGFNWGYDPYHFGAPEGSYSTDPNGAKRVLEFRRMVKGLADLGLGTVMDVVYNHTNAAGQNQSSVLDKIVPGYYYKRDDTGAVTTSICCPETAPEFLMMEKLVADTGVRWVRDYKVGGFRFDAMQLHPLQQMLNFKAAIQAVDPSAYVYGEGWKDSNTNGADLRFVGAQQPNLGGSGLGSFNDRLRDSVRGGGPFDSGVAHVLRQGLISGLFYAPNALNSGSAAEKDELLKATDNIRVWQAAGLDSYRFVDSAGTTVTGREVKYSGQESGYTEDPSEAINYVEKHDNETLWDISAYKHAAGTPTAARVRAHNVGVSTVLLAQGIPFMQAGMELIRSKSQDRDSYDSGDWFNELDLTGQTSNWALGLPVKYKNEANWPQNRLIFADVTAESTAADRKFVYDVTREWLQIRKSSTLFRLRTAEQIKGRMTMLNTGTSQIPGVVAYRIDGCATPELTGNTFGAVVTIYNPTTNVIALPLYKDETFVLHPVQQQSVDATARSAKHDATIGFTVPARTTAVFVKEAQASCAPYAVPVFVRGSFTDWAAKPEFELKFAGGSAYATSGPVPAGAQQFKIADNDWKGPTNCGAASDGVQVSLATPLGIVCNDNSKNLNFTSPAAGNYVFALDATNVAAPILTVSAAPPATKQLFVRGGFNDWGNGPAPTAPLAWDGIGKYRAVIADLPAQTFDFKIADNDWTGATNCGGAADGTSVTIGQPYQLTCNNDSKNVKVTFPSAGSYLFAVDAAFRLTVEKVPFAASLYVRGLNGDWSDAAGNRMSYLGGGIYQYKRGLAISEQKFKIADSGWTAGTDCGASSPATLNTPLTLACQGPGNGDIAFAVPAAGTYTFSLDATNTGAPKLTVSGP